MKYVLFIILLAFSFSYSHKEIRVEMLYRTLVPLSNYTAYINVHGNIGSTAETFIIGQNFNSLPSFIRNDSLFFPFSIPYLFSPDTSCFPHNGYTVYNTMISSSRNSSVKNRFLSGDYDDCLSFSSFTYSYLFYNLSSYFVNNASFINSSPVYNDNRISTYAFNYVGYRSPEGVFATPNVVYRQSFFPTSSDTTLLYAMSSSESNAYISTHGCSLSSLSGSNPPFPFCSFSSFHWTSSSREYFDTTSFYVIDDNTAARISFREFSPSSAFIFADTSKTHLPPAENYLIFSLAAPPRQLSDLAYLFDIYRQNYDKIGNYEVDVVPVAPPTSYSFYSNGNTYYYRSLPAQDTSTCTPSDFSSDILYNFYHATKHNSSGLTTEFRDYDFSCVSWLSGYSFIPSFAIDENWLACRTFSNNYYESYSQLDCNGFLGVAHSIETPPGDFNAEHSCKMPAQSSGLGWSVARFCLGSQSLSYDSDNGSYHVAQDTLSDGSPSPNPSNSLPNDGSKLTETVYTPPVPVSGDVMPGDLVPDVIQPPSQNITPPSLPPSVIQGNTDNSNSGILELLKSIYNTLIQPFSSPEITESDVIVSDTLAIFNFDTLSIPLPTQEDFALDTSFNFIDSLFPQKINIDTISFLDTTFFNEVVQTSQSAFSQAIEPLTTIFPSQGDACACFDLSATYGTIGGSSFDVSFIAQIICDNIALIRTIILLIVGFSCVFTFINFFSKEL